MSLAAGTRLGSYVVEAPLGAGGMGEVYRAHDTTLGRDVALKILPDAVAADPDSLARFEREARALAALNHSNIAQIYGVEAANRSRALVMELVTGSTLEETLRGGALSTSEALSIARQLADALDAAHEKGIVHRDLKPANIKVRPDGTVKVLDFGLAKALAGNGVPTLQRGSLSTVLGTGVGVVVGTPAYMSPEQATGADVDKRTDIWAFGCVLWEMLTGRRLFAGDTPPAAIGAVLGQPIPLEALPPSVPSRVRRLIARCLTRDLRQRLRDIGDARADLVDEPDEPVSRRAGGVRWLPWSVAAFAASIAAAMLALWLRAGSDHVVREVLVATLPTPKRFAQTLVLSPDGRQAVFGTYDPAGIYRLYRRDLDSPALDPELMPDSDSEVAFFSPDSRWIGSFTTTGRLVKVAAHGAPTPVVICNLNGAFPGVIPIGVWTDDDRIVFGGPKGLFVVPASGGTPQSLLTSEAAVDESSAVATDYDAESRVLIFGVLPSLQIWAQKLSASGLEGKPRRLVTAARGGLPRLSSTGHLVYPELRPGSARAFRLVAAPFDAATLTVGPSVSVVDDLPGGAFFLSRSGTLVYPSAFPSETNRLVWVTRTGAATAFSPVGVYSDPAVAPSGDAAYTVADGVRQHIWMHSVSGGEAPVTSGDTMFAMTPAWRPGTDTVSYATATGEIMLAALRRPETALVPSGPLTLGTSWSPDGRYLAAMRNDPNTGWDVVVIDASTPSKVRMEPFASTPALEARPTFSPNGRLIAYASNEKDRNRIEVYVRPFPGPSSPWQVSTDGGDEPRWSKDGTEIFYRDGHHMLARRISPGGDPVGVPATLFDDDFENRGLATDYDVAPDGRFLMLKAEGPRESVAVIAVNWLEVLKRRVQQKTP